METEITTLIDILAKLLTAAFIVAPTVLGFLIYNKMNKRGNPKIQMLEAADQEIVEGTNEALNIILTRLDAIEVAVEEIASDSPRPNEVKGFKSSK